MGKLSTSWFFCLMLSFVGSSTYATEAIPFYTYYDEPPFSIDQPDNLTKKLADWLSRKSNGAYQFIPTQLPRRRLDVTVLNTPNWQGVVAWAGPGFFLDTQRTKYLWTAAYMNDINLIVSHRNKPIDFKGPSSLHGRIIGAVLGRQLNDFQNDIDAGKITREDAGSALSNLKKLQLQRIDATFIPQMSLPYYRKQLPDLDQWLFVAKKPRSQVARHLFVARSQLRLHQFLNQALSQLPQDAEWRGIMQQTTPAQTSP